MFSWQNKIKYNMYVLGYYILLDYMDIIFNVFNWYEILI